MAADAPTRRAAELRALQDGPWDVVIVGGGIVGAGALLDATSRGLRAALVEQDDIASGTSSRSSRLIHGGLRYLEQYQFGVVVESLAERARLLRLAPHLVRLQEFLFPLHGLPVVTRAFYGSGMLLYDLLGSARSGGLHRHLGTKATLEYAPALHREGLRGGLVYHDAMEDDARVTLAVLRTALDGGATAVTRVRATGPLHDGRTIAGIRARDAITGAELDIRAPRVLDATGVWASRPDRPFGAGSFTVVPSRGSHILVPRERLPVRGGITLRVPGKVVFMVPWPRHWIIGTTDAPYRGSVDHPSASGEEVDSSHRHGEPGDGRGPVAGRRRGHVRGTPSAGRDPRTRGRPSRRQPRITGSRATRTASSASAAASTRPTGSWRAMRSMRSLGGRGETSPERDRGPAAARRR